MRLLGQRTEQKKAVHGNPHISKSPMLCRSIVIYWLAIPNQADKTCLSFLNASSEQRLNETFSAMAAYNLDVLDFPETRIAANSASLGWSGFVESAVR